MKKILLIVLFISVGFSQQKWNMEFMREYGGVTYAPNSDKPYTGSVFSLDSLGTKKEEGKYRNGLKNGKWTSWFENGQKRYEETWKDGKLANQVKESIDYRNEVKVDRTDAKSTAGALLRAYKEQDLRTIATLSTKSDHDFIIEMANSGDSHNHYRNFMEVNFSGWREEGVQAWNGQLEEVRYKQSRTKIRASVKFGELGPEEVLVVKLKCEEGKWCSLQIENPSPDMFLEWGVDELKCTSGL
jgi:hypothetical protein|tara:strand:+ start:71 stop:799 length:729 start_codon:yes stop_codon:yes gene_type:complete